MLWLVAAVFGIFKEEILGCSPLDLKTHMQMHSSLNGLDDMFLKCIFFKTNFPNISIFQDASTLRTKKGNNQCWFLRGARCFQLWWMLSAVGV